VNAEPPGAKSPVQHPREFGLPPFRPSRGPDAAAVEPYRDLIELPVPKPGAIQICKELTCAFGDVGLISLRAVRRVCNGPVMEERMTHPPAACVSEVIAAQRWQPTLEPVLKSLTPAGPDKIRVVRGELEVDAAGEPAGRRTRIDIFGGR
jgi:hypothetical protein